MVILRKYIVEDVKQELNGLLETFKQGKQPTVEELETAKNGIDNLVVEGKKTLEELKKNPEENKEQIAKMEEAIRKLASCSKCVDDHAKADKEEEQKKKEESTAKAGPNRYEIYNAYAIAAAECKLEDELKNAVNAIKENNFITISVEEFLTRIRKANTDKKKVLVAPQEMRSLGSMLQKGNIKINAKNIDIDITGSIGKNAEEDTLKFDGTQIETGSYIIQRSNSGKVGLRIHGEEYAFIGIYVTDESDTLVVKNWLLSIEPTPRELKIDNALIAMEQYLGTAYKQDSTEKLRTEDTDEALANMDCSEFVCRYFKELGLSESIPYFTTKIMVSDNFANTYVDKLQYIEGGGDKNFKDIQKGDIFVYNGHTGIVLEYDEAIGNRGSYDNAFNRNNGGSTQISCVRKSVYQRTGKALSDHENWKGYFRPILNNLKK